MLTKGAIGNLVNRYRAVLQKCNLINTFGSLAVASMLVLGGAAVADAEQVNVTSITPAGTEVTKNYGGWKTITGTGNSIIDSHFDGFTRNTTQAAGGVVIYNQGAETTITGGSFKNNIITTTSNGRGGAIYNTGNLTITGTDFVSNKFDIAKSTSGYGGGAIGTSGGNVTIEKCTFTGNSTTREGGAVYAQQGNVVVKNSTFTGNESTKNRGGAIVVQKGATLTLQGKNTFAGNKAASAGGAISVVYPANNEGPCKVIFDTDSVTIFEANEASYGGALDIVDTFETKEGSQLIFRGNKATGSGGGAISLTTTKASYNAGIKPSVEFNSKTIFEDNSSNGNGGAIWVYNSTCDVTFNADAEFKNNTDYSGKNDIHNDGNIAINNATVTIDGGISSTKDDDGNASGTITGTGDATIVITSVDTKVEAQKTTGVKAKATGEVNDAHGGSKEAFMKQIAASNGLEFGGMEEGLVAGAVDASGKRAKNSIMDAALKQASVTTVALDKILTNDVRKRLGDIRSDKNTTGVWMRWDGGKLQGNGLTNDFNTIQIGGDTKVGKNCRLGVAGTFTHGDAEFARGDAELEGFTFATYATWMGENGMFADVIARLGQFSNEMYVEGRNGDMDNRVFSLSGEYGWRLPVCDQFFVEPQVELAYTYVSSDDLQLGDVKYQFDSVDSLTGRLGVVFGWNLPDDRGNVYARASVLQQFMGDAKISGAVTGGKALTQEIDGDDTWLEYGIGANVKLTEKTYIWADIERTEGAEIDEEWRGTVGIRYSF